MSLRVLFKEIGQEKADSFRIIAEFFKKSAAAVCCSDKILTGEVNEQQIKCYLCLYFILLHSIYIFFFNLFGQNFVSGADGWNHIKGSSAKK